MTRTHWKTATSAELLPSCTGLWHGHFESVFQFPMRELRALISIHIRDLLRSSNVEQQRQTPRQERPGEARDAPEMIKGFTCCTNRSTKLQQMSVLMAYESGKKRGAPMMLERKQEASPSADSDVIE